MIPVLETRRLVLRALELADAEQTQKLFPHWEIVRYLLSQVPWPYPPDGAYKFYKEVALPAMARGEAWHWSLRLKSQPEQIIGNITLRRGNSDNRGFWLGLPWHRQGLMSEACDAITEFWFSALGFPVLRTAKAAANLSSRRISEKQGMRLIGTSEKDYVSGRLPTEIWEITSEEWKVRARSASV